MTSVRVEGFLPSRCGFRFANEFDRAPMVSVAGVGFGDASQGLCGGMAFAALDLFHAGAEPSRLAEPPAAGSPAFRYLVKRAFASFDLPIGPAKYYVWTVLPDAGGPLGSGGVWSRTAAREWPRLRRLIEGGTPAPLGLIRVRSANPMALAADHQVVAYGFDLDEPTGRVRLPVYDPNRPMDDTAALELRLPPAEPGPVSYAGGGPVRGFFVTPYYRADPDGALA